MFREVAAVSKAESVKQSEDNRRKKSSKEMNSQPAAKKARLVNEPPTTSEDAMQETGEIPKFDLAEQIMAEQRKITAVRRKGPGKMAKPPQKQHPAESIARNVIPRPILSGPGQIIAEIVARDIEELCVGNTSRPGRQGI
jgi:hypothetical protein